MKILRKVLTTLGIISVACAATLLSTIIGGKILGVDLEVVYPADIPITMWLFCIISVLAIMSLATIWYIKSLKLKPTLKNGFYFGALIVPFGFVGDIILLVPHTNGVDILISYYEQPAYWITLGLIVGVCALIGHLMPKNNRRKK